MAFHQSPSLRSVVGTVASEPTSLAIHASTSQQSEYASHIETLNLYHTVPALLEPFLSTFRSLRSLSLTAQGGYRIAQGSQLHNLLATLSQYAGHCLQDLTLHLKRCDFEEIGAWKELGNLMASEKLTNVDVDALYLGSDHEGTAPWLYRILPPILKTLRLGKVDEMINHLKKKCETRSQPSP